MTSIFLYSLGILRSNEINFYITIVIDPVLLSLLNIWEGYYWFDVHLHQCLTAGSWPNNQGGGWCYIDGYVGIWKHCVTVVRSLSRSLTVHGHNKRICPCQEGRAHWQAGRLSYWTKSSCNTSESSCCSFLLPMNEFRVELLHIILYFKGHTFCRFLSKSICIHSFKLKCFCFSCLLPFEHELVIGQLTVKHYKR